MNDASAMLEAHVRFELSRWRGPAFEEMVAHEVAAVFRWLETTPLADLVSADEVTGVVQRVVVELPISDGLVALVDEGFTRPTTRWPTTRRPGWTGSFGANPTTVSSTWWWQRGRSATSSPRSSRVARSTRGWSLMCSIGGSRITC